MATIKFLSNVFGRPAEDREPVPAAVPVPEPHVETPPSVNGAAAEPRLRAVVDGAFSLSSPAGVLVIGWLEQDGTSALQGSLRLADDQTPIPATWSFRYRRADVARYLEKAAGAADLYGFVAFFKFDLPEPVSKGRVEFRCDGDIHGHDLESADFDSVHAAEALRGVWSFAARELGKALDPLPAELLCALPGESVAAKDLRFFVDHCLQLPTGVFVDGWLANAAGSEPRVYLVDESQPPRSAVLSDNWVRTARPDVVEALKDFPALPRKNGFVAFARMPAPEEPASLLALYLVGADGTVVRQPLDAQQPQDWRTAATSVLGAFKTTNPKVATLVADHVGPALEAIAAARHKPLPPTTLRWIGTPPEAPAASVIVPLWGSLDLVRFQLASFRAAAQPQWELIFALDDPTLEDAFFNLAEDWLALYGRPFAIASWDRNAGFHRALNLASRMARADVLVFMHADVLAESADWLAKLLDAFARDPQCGIVGPKLLYDDGTIQSEGVRTKPAPRAAAFTVPELVNRGQPDGPGKDPRQVEGVTTACMAIRRSLFESLGGFDGGFLLQHAFAELDLCGRAAQAGWRCVLEPAVTLRHFEGVATALAAGTEPLLADPAWREKVQLCNAWRLAARAPKGAA